MASSKRSKAVPTDDELGELFEGIGDDAAIKKSTKTKSSAAAKQKTTDSVEQDILAELENQLGEKPPSRPHTPRVREVAKPIKRTAANTPPPAAADAGRKSTESAAHSSSAEADKKAPAKQQSSSSSGGSGGGGGGGGSWWGGLLSTATAAMKQAEAAVSQIQQTEEAKKWAEQVRGNVGALRGLGDELRHRALPTFTNILHTLAPPIASHERLLIHITHDLVGYPSLDPLVYGVFSRVMAQVEGGDLMVIQRGQESTLRGSGPGSSNADGSDKGGATGAAARFLGGVVSSVGQSTAGWRDGPWWRQTDPRSLGTVDGLVEGTKLCRASAEGYAADFFSANGGVEAAKKRAIEPLSESNPVRSSDIFLAVQAVRVLPEAALFAASTASNKGKEGAEDDEKADGDICFAVYLLDPVHEIQYATVSQRVPARWIAWLDSPAKGDDDSSSSSEDDEDEDEEEEDSSDDSASTTSADARFRAEFGHVPPEIREILESGGVDPREWAAEWVEEALGLAVGVVAQRYVARRMGVGEEATIGQGSKRKVETVLAEGGNEAARAGLI
ncbi:hypothetical protein VTJ83DRAFT_113 [Remersonia thermophila]|uniref:Maintenance of telomere capping protein 1 n=1 Tax=Remersonia thermophila TaxID=72144 RepID=A0ABR4DKA2_9PEZI